jgi:RNA polymerase sigma factor (sigma-70 family)
LLARFLAGRDEAGEQAFEALVIRHGPMVMRVCRNILDDPQDVHDAFQAVFLVLARRAGAIRNRESVGSWLHGVAVRVTARVRLKAIRRGIRDRRTNQVAETLAAAGPWRTDEPEAERQDGAEVVHQEVSRLPDKYRAPIVLCYLEGLTHDEAAARLSWPVGTVRSRLARARDTLRNRLARRGVTSPAVLGPLTGRLASEPIAPSASAAAIHRELAASIAKAVSQLSAGRTAAVVSVASPSLLLAQGVLKTMLLKKLFVAACALLPLGMIPLGGGMLLALKSQAQDQRPPAAASTKKAQTDVPKDAPKPPDVDPMVKKLLEAARERIKAQTLYYEQGRITLDRFIDACRQLELAELRAASTDAERLAIKKRALQLLGEIEDRERAELTVGRGSNGDVAEIVLRRTQAEIDLRTSQKEASDLASILQRLSDLERKVKELQDANRAKAGH